MKRIWGSVFFATFILMTVTGNSSFAVQAINSNRLRRSPRASLSS